MDLAPGKKIYFLSDFHLGAPNNIESRQREDAVVAFLKQAKQDAAAFFIVGDIFDFWFEYKTVVPKGFIRLCRYPIANLYRQS
jgi:UDP-2,3-diacylglucosamine hydrolase